VKELTTRQAEIFAWIREQIQGGLPPTIREIGGKFGIRSTNGVAEKIEFLVRHGYLTKLSGAKSRGLMLTPLGHVSPGYVPPAPPVPTGNGAVAHLRELVAELNAVPWDGIGPSLSDAMMRAATYLHRLDEGA
jgi:SOS-response transcriptional repressor LexA